MNNLFVFLSLMMGVCALTYAQIYKWVDGQGNVHFSDTPHEGAEIIIIPDTQSFSPPISPAHEVPTSEQTEQMQNNQKNTYTNIAIAQPEKGATIRNNQGFVAVSVQVEPHLFRGNKLQLIYDSNPIGEPQQSPSFEISGMYRGTHTLAVQVIDAEENAIETSDPITIYVFRPRVGMVPETRPH